MEANNNSKSFKVSFRGKVVGAPTPKSFIMEEWLDGERLVTIEGRQGDSSPPRVTFSEEGMKAMAGPYVDAIVIKGYAQDCYRHWQSI
ncbi:hypothetical protein PIB30_046329 [Stylosanthes scabra]|uniref:Uncharacterized protein n=1 Tax=Stylosanthes scabra TaxID=79078 RepID=A0ABU6UIA4_9FABA|nr:hypothetical protein [Stylosanthes scabra]